MDDEPSAFKDTLNHAAWQVQAREVLQLAVLLPSQLGRSVPSPQCNAETLPVSKQLRPPKSDAAFAPRCAEVGRPEESAEAGRAQACLSRIINPALELTVLCTRPCRQASQPPCRCACAFRTTSKRACTKTQMLTPLTASPASQAMAKAYRLPHRLVFRVGDETQYSPHDYSTIQLHDNNLCIPCNGLGVDLSREGEKSSLPNQ